MTSIFFLISVAFMLTHEMDATHKYEWRLLPILKRLNDQQGFVWFVLLHVPLYVALFWAFWLQDGESARQKVRLGFDLFGIIHLGLHFLLRNHPKYEFHHWLSWLLIIGAAIAGTIDLALLLG